MVTLHLEVWNMYVERGGYGFGGVESWGSFKAGEKGPLSSTSDITDLTIEKADFDSPIRYKVAEMAKSKTVCGSIEP